MSTHKVIAGRGDRVTVDGLCEVARCEVSPPASIASDPAAVLRLNAA